MLMQLIEHTPSKQAVVRSNRAGRAISFAICDFGFTICPRADT